MFRNKKFKRIFYNTVLKELPGTSWGHETRRQLLKPIKSQHREPEHRQMPGKTWGTHHRTGDTIWVLRDTQEFF